MPPASSWPVRRLDELAAAQSSSALAFGSPPSRRPQLLRRLLLLRLNRREHVKLRRRLLSQGAVAPSSSVAFRSVASVSLELASRDSEPARRDPDRSGVRGHARQRVESSPLAASFD